MSDVSLRRCTKCGEEKPATTTYFYKQTSPSPGLYLKGQCKECYIKLQKAYYETNADAISVRMQTYYLEHAEERKAYEKTYKREHNESVRARKKAYREAQRNKSHSPS